MKLKDLEKAGAFVSADGVKKTLSWTNPQGKSFTFDVFILRRSYGAIERILLDDEGRSRGALTISECILFGDAGEKMSYEQAYQLEPSLARVFMDAVREVNAINTAQEDAAKN